MGWLHRLLVVMVVAALAFVVFGQVSEYASGPVLVRIDGRSDLTAKSAEIVASVNVAAGDRVNEGEVLARFYDAAERAELTRADEELELQLAKSLRDPSDESARSALIALRASKALAEAKLEERTLRAPFRGVVSDVRIRKGQLLSAGEVVVSVRADEVRASVVAMLPGYYRPMLHVGAPMRLQMSGFPYAYREVAIDSVGDEVIGPKEVARYLGDERADTVTVTGPTILVRAHLPTTSFVVDDKEYAYFDGMQGNADVRVRRMSLAMSLFPSLRAIFHHAAR